MHDYDFLGIEICDTNGRFGFRKRKRYSTIIITERKICSSNYVSYDNNQTLLCKYSLALQKRALDSSICVFFVGSSTTNAI